MIAFDFPPLGDTQPREDNPVIHQNQERTLVWDGGDGYYITRQEDVAAVAYRCHYPGGSAPCNAATADAYATWVLSTPRDGRIA